MNFLAHTFLSGENTKIMLGGFIADSVKGNYSDLFEKDICFGIRLHRAIDKFTDNHYVVAKSKHRINPDLHKYSGVVIDMLFDHFLAKHWKNYSSISLEQYSSNTYFILNKYFDILPSRSQKMLPYLIIHNWFETYADLDKMQQHFNGMARRTSFDSHMERAVEIITPNYNLFEEEFKSFFPELILFAKQFLIDELELT